MSLCHVYDSPAMCRIFNATSDKLFLNILRALSLFLIISVLRHTKERYSQLQRLLQKLLISQG